MDDEDEEKIFTLKEVLALIKQISTLDTECVACMMTAFVGYCDTQHTCDTK